MKISYRLAALAALPSAAFCVLAFLQFSEQLDRARQAEAEFEISKVAAKAGDLLHASQRERGMTIGWLGGGGKTPMDRIDGLRADTDQRLQSLREQIAVASESLGDGMPEGFAAAMNQADGLRELRRRVNAVEATGEDVYQFHTSLHLSLLQAYPGIYGSGKFVRATRAYAALLRGKEDFGVHRAVGNVTFVKDRFGAVALPRFFASMAVAEQQLGLFADTGSPELAQQLRDAGESPAAKKVRELRAIAVAKSKEGQFGVVPGEWWDAITEWIDAIKEVEDATASALQADARSRYEGALRAAYTYGAVTLALLLLTALAVAVLARSMMRRVRRLRAGLSELAAGNLGVRVAASSGDELDAMTADFNSSAEVLAQTLLDVRAIATRIERQYREVANAGPALADNAQMQAASLQEIRASVLEIEGFGGTISSQSANVGTAASEAVNLVRDGRDATERMSAAMARIDEGGQSVAEILKTIEDIAFQTNLLALNAAVEAARAGDAGRGFAVVADEVRMLAMRSANAVEEVGKLVADSSERTKVGSEVAVEVRELLCGIDGASGRVTESLSQVVEGTQQQESRLSVVNNSIASLDRVTQGNAGSSEELASSVQVVNEAIESLKQKLDRFRFEESLVSASGQVPVDEEIPIEA